MSYTRSYTHYEPVYGSRTVSYPASEHGGTMTVNFQETATVYINVTVDTNPFDHSISNTNASANHLTAAVVGMQGAQIAAIRDSANRVSRSVIKGFNNLANKDISSQKAEEFTRMQAKNALMTDLYHALEEKLSRMDADLARLQRHYSAIFRDMDEDLSKRIKELNRPAFQLVEEGREAVVLTPYKTDGALGIEQTSEDGRMNNLLAGARIRSKVSDVLSHVSDYIYKCENYKDNVEGMLDNTSALRAEREYVPAIVCEKVSMTAPGSVEYQTFAPEMRSAGSVRDTVGRCAAAQTLPWKETSGSEMSMIDKSFTQLVEEESRTNTENDPVRLRVYQEMMTLWQNNKDYMKSL